jgi:hypothetical protein
MKKIFVLVLVLVFIPCFSLHGQMVVFDAAVAALIENTKVEQVLFYGQMLLDNISQIDATVDLYKKSVEQIALAARNIESAKDIKSWDDFTDWYNRQLYFERKAVESVKGVKVTIGKKEYSLLDIEGMADGVNDTHFEYWNNQFSEDQRRAMWIELGLSPANYAYVQPFRLKGREIARQLFAASEIINDKNMKSSSENKDILDKHERDSLKSPENQMGQKEVEQDLLKVNISSNEKLSDIAALQAKHLEYLGVKEYLDNTPPSTPLLSDWPEDGFTKFPDK